MASLLRRLDANGDFTFGRGKENYISGPAATAQRLACRLKLITGEWFRDTDAGTPWFQPEDSVVRPIMGGPRDLPYTEAVVKTVILGTEDVASLSSFEMSYTSGNRHLEIVGEVVDESGESVAFSVESP